MEEGTYQVGRFRWIDGTGVDDVVSLRVSANYFDVNTGEDILLLSRDDALGMAAALMVEADQCG